MHDWLIASFNQSCCNHQPGNISGQVAESKAFVSAPHGLGATPTTSAEAERRRAANSTQAGENASALAKGRGRREGLVMLKAR